MLGRTSDAVVFDMDGVLCDSEPSGGAGVAEMLGRRYGVVATREDFLPFVGAPPGGSAPGSRRATNM